MILSIGPWEGGQLIILDICFPYTLNHIIRLLSFYTDSSVYEDTHLLRVRLTSYILFKMNEIAQLIEQIRACETKAPLLRFGFSRPYE